MLHFYNNAKALLEKSHFDNNAESIIVKVQHVHLLQYSRRPIFASPSTWLGGILKAPPLACLSKFTSSSSGNDCLQVGFFNALALKNSGSPLVSLGDEHNIYIS